MTCGPAVFDRYVLTLMEAHLSKAPAECFEAACKAIAGFAAKVANHRRPLLRARVGRDRRGCDPKDDLAPPHSITSSARARRDDDSRNPMPRNVRRLRTSSSLVG